MKQPSGDISRNAGTARSTNFGNGGSASPARGTDTAESSGRNVDVSRTFEEYAGLGLVTGKYSAIQPGGLSNNLAIHLLVEGIQALY